MNFGGIKIYNKIINCVHHELKICPIAWYVLYQEFSMSTRIIPFANGIIFWV